MHFRDAHWRDKKASAEEAAARALKMSLEPGDRVEEAKASNTSRMVCKQASWRKVAVPARYVRSQMFT